MLDNCSLSCQPSKRPPKITKNDALRTSARALTFVVVSELLPIFTAVLVWNITVPVAAAEPEGHSVALFGGGGDVAI